MSNTNDSIIKKIAKLMELSRSSNEAESLAAMKKAQSLMLEYQVSEAQIKIAQNNLGNDLQKQNIEIEQDGKFKEWEKTLLDLIGENNFCKVLFFPKTSKIQIYGTISDAEMVINFYSMVREQMIMFAGIAFKLAFSSLNANTWKNNYYMGMLSKIRENLKAARKQITDNTMQIGQVAESNTTVFAIVLKKQEIVNTFYEENKGKVKTTYSKFNYQHGAYSQGYKDGDMISLEK